MAPDSTKPGTTVASVPLSEGDSIELGHRIREYEAELIPTNAIEYALVERMAVSSIRMDRGVSFEAASLALVIRKAEDDFVAPEGTPVQKLAKLRAEASARALFDPSKEATLARKYEAAAERSFFRCLKELREMQKPTKALDPKVKEAVFRQELGSFLAANAANDEFMARYEKSLDDDHLMADPMPRRGVSVPQSPPRPTAGGSFEVPFSIGKPR